MPEPTPGTIRSSAVAADWALDAADAVACERLARTLCTGGHDQVDDPEWVARARDAWEDVPVPLRRGVRRFRRHSGPHGTLVIGGLPVDQAALPATPSVPGSVQRQATVSAAVLTMVACGLGEPLAYLAEKSGALVQDVVPVPGQETFHGNAGSVRLSFHTENGFHPHPPDYVIFLCLRADHDRRAGMRLVGLRQALPLLTPASRDALFAPEFITTPPPSFGPDRAGSQPVVEPRAVLSGAAEDPDIRMAQLVTTPLTPRATTALTEFGRACEATARTLCLAPGDLVIIDNRVTVHGRTAFHPRYDGEDRWLQRTYVTTDLRRSRDHRPRDGHILTR
ncbi:L-asparagine oxygenase [Streptomyces alfalfae]|uniref:L-asparagine oxygenase n=1 Tax=Streptomyces alfalfae TaxID=1642299 RepID=A0ABN4VEB2_9ACTN|nr:TauD/TfdA family dioxygenase [Streptomyces alfalfae]APY85530.1 L-asparagine oxygenase [Streptomyces alfalfae]AYA15885.1 L-asparagine oxygenase [Streptomyces fradiae]RXX39359.1 L-asparagine oxygenase [Streptomyces alfalfae]RZM96275.1 L-asparagine oxygenase [Streptomyces alfalfae]